MKKLFVAPALFLMLFSCGNPLEKDLLSDVNELCRCNLIINKGSEGMQDCMKTQTEMRKKYIEDEKMHEKLMKKVNECVAENEEE